MNKEKLLNFVEELICWIIVVIILQFIAHKSGWTDISIKDNIIGLIIGWIIWKAIILAMKKKVTLAYRTEQIYHQRARHTDAELINNATNGNLRRR